LNPRPPECKRRTASGFFDLPQPDIDWDAFKNWLFKTHSRSYARDIFNVARKYHKVLWDSREVQRLHSLNGPSRRFVMAGLSNLSKFLGVYKAWHGIIENSGLKWSSGNDDALIIARLTKAVEGDEVVKWIRQVKAAIPEFSVFMDFLAVTGLRYKEAINSWNLIVKLSKENHLGDYYKKERSVLEHFRFKDLFIRRSKKAFISFVPVTIVKEISKGKPLTRNILSKRIQRRRIEERFSDVREFHASFMLKYLRQPEIDFIHGRVSSNVFMRNYFNPVWVIDLKERTLKAANEILQQIKS